MTAFDYAQGLICRANYWVKCPDGEFGPWAPHWQHIGISVVIGLTVIYVMLKIFNIKL